MNYFVEVHTTHHNRRLTIVRMAASSECDAFATLLHMLDEAYGEEEQPAKKTRDWKPWTTEGWSLLNAPIFENDFGESTIFCVRSYGERAQVTEGVFTL